jgi:F-type H+-transporting ATPase subunit beta
VFVGVGERTVKVTRHEMADSGVVNLENLEESKVAMVYGQMNEPPGNRLRCRSDWSDHYNFRDLKARTCVVLVDNIYRFQ